MSASMVKCSVSLYSSVLLLLAVQVATVVFICYNVISSPAQIQSRILLDREQRYIILHDLTSKKSENEDNRKVYHVPYQPQLKSGKNAHSMLEDSSLIHEKLHSPQQIQIEGMHSHRQLLIKKNQQESQKSSIQKEKNPVTESTEKEQRTISTRYLKPLNLMKAVKQRRVYSAMKNNAKTLMNELKEELTSTEHLEYLKLPSAHPEADKDKMQISNRKSNSSSHKLKDHIHSTSSIRDQHSNVRNVSHTGDHHYGSRNRSHTVEHRRTLNQLHTGDQYYRSHRTSHSGSQQHGKNKIQTSTKNRLHSTKQHHKMLLTSDQKKLSKEKQAKMTINNNQNMCESTLEPLVECSKILPRNLTGLEAVGSDIMFTIRTTTKYHKSRLPVLFDTWLNDIEPKNMFIVTDGQDEQLETKIESLGMNYVNIHAGGSYNRSDLCCKAGAEVELLLLPANSKLNWFCHVDDDMYVVYKSLIEALSHFDPTKEKVYFGRSGSLWEEPRKVKNDSLIGTPGEPYHFAVGGIYCLSRTLVEAAMPHLVGCTAFAESCHKAKEPEDVTLGLIIGAVLKEKLYRTNIIYTHGLSLLTSIPSSHLRKQIAFSYGFGAMGSWSTLPNVVFVPGGLFNIDEDVSQFKSVHCHLNPGLQWCIEKKQQLIAKRKQQRNRKDVVCECSWRKLTCCKTIQNTRKQKTIPNYHHFYHFE